VLAVSLFVGQWRSPTVKFLAIVPLCLIGISIAETYRLLNQRRLHRLREPEALLHGLADPDRLAIARDPDRSDHGIRRAAAIFVTGLLLFLLLIVVNGRPTPKDTFALEIPALPSSSTTPASTNPATDSLMVWSVDRPASTVPAGALPLFLGALMIVAFGLWYPRLEFSADAKGGLGITEKLVAPILSLSLVALGVGQQADAAHTDADVKLTRAGLPPVIRSDAGLSFYLQDRAKLNQASVDELSKNIETLGKNLATSPAKVLDNGAPANNLSPTDLDNLVKALNGVKLSLKDPVTVNYPSSDPQIAALANRVQLAEDNSSRAQFAATTAGGAAQQAKTNAEAALSQAKTTADGLSRDRANECDSVQAQLNRWNGAVHTDQTLVDQDRKARDNLFERISDVWNTQNFQKEMLHQQALDEAQSEVGEFTAEARQLGCPNAPTSATLAANH
jgi:hypothetical protein